MRYSSRCLGLLLGLALTSAMAPAKCGKDMYYWGKWDGKAMCQNCPIGRHSGGCTNCKADPEGTRCIEGCPSGKFHSESGCSDCAAGKFQGANGMHDCHDCPAGMMQNKAGMHKCEACSIGRYQDEKGSTSCHGCRMCKAGKFGSTPTTGMDSADMCRCELCPVGTESKDGYASCTKCTPGRFAQDLGKSECQLCPEGKYASGTGSTVCRSCHHGWTTGAPGAEEKDDCNVEHVVKCPAGRTMVVVGMEAGVEKHACANCDAGKYGYTDKNYKHGGRCMKCQAYHYQPGTGRTDCLQCIGGEVSGDATKCIRPTENPTASPTADPTTFPTPPPTPPTQAPTRSPTVVPGDCEVSDWSKTWSECSQKCGGGIQFLSRKIVVAPQGTGKPCPLLKKERNCNTAPCPVHCKFEWTEWSVCSSTCGGGYKYQSIVVHEHAQHGGDECPKVREEVCNLQACPTPAPSKAPTIHIPTPYPTPHPTKYPTTPAPTENPTKSPTAPPTPIPDPLDCKVSEWTKGACSKSCGTGREAVWSRKIVHQAKFGGKACNAVDHYLVKTIDCPDVNCPVDCVVSEWSGPTACTESCGVGTTKRTRTIVTSPQFGGEACPYLEVAEACNTQSCPRDCEVGIWSDFSTCSKTCEGGLQMRYRAIKRDAKYGGKACPPLSLTESCNEHPCAVHCEVSKWGDWSDCTKTCGGGMQKRTRSVTKESAKGGRECPPLSQTQACSADACPVDCVMSEWKSWSECSTTCGGGFQTRTRSVTTPAQHGGKACPNAYLSQVCNKKQCPVACEVSAWGNWHSCDASCKVYGAEKNPIQRRHRSVEQPAVWGGKACPELHESRECNTHHCPRDCVQEPWGPWSECTSTCGTDGTMKRMREIKVWPAWGGEACGHRDDLEICGRSPCPVDCEVTKWSEWSSCTKTCGTGTKTRTRRITKKADHKGTICPSDLSETVSCATHQCPVDCKMSAWSDFTMCTKTCGGGYYHRTRQIEVHPVNGGEPCPFPRRESKTCEHDPCPNDCIVGDWSLFNACSKSCNGGKQERYRSILTSASHGGHECPITHETRDCNMEACAVDCAVGKWSAWTSCSKTCGGGKRSRTRVSTPPKNGGMECPFAEEEEECNGEKPCPEDCVLSKWGEWKICSATCGAGMQSRSRYVEQSAAYGGKACAHLEDSRICNTFMCPLDCVMKPWSDWSACSRSCGTVGLKTRHRQVKSIPEAGGAPCGDLVERSPCNQGDCPVHCETSTWSAWTDCSATCGTAFITRTRTIEVHAKAGGYHCPALKEQQKCKETGPCPVDCKTTGWLTWDPCTLSCGGGTSDRRRSVTSMPQHGGKACPILRETKKCNTQACPRDCMMQVWGKWSPCTHTCGGGTRFRFRSMKYAAAYGGAKCPHYKDTGKCNVDACPVDCYVSDWKPWLKCDRTCGSGVRRRFRSVVVEPQGAGKRCPELKDESLCNVGNCPQDCKVSKWNEFGDCSKSCGPGGRRFRTRVIQKKPLYNGKPCPEIQQSQECDLGPCPVHCVVSDWTHTSACDRSCGGGIRTRERRVLQKQAHGGTCPHLKESVQCNTDRCPVDCLMGEWSLYTTCSAQCGTGFQTRERIVRIQAKHGGKPCGETMAINFCNTHQCGVDCHVTEWSDWSECTQSCGKGGTWFRTRAVIAEADGIGEPCPALKMEAPCVVHEHCPVDCVIDHDTEWDGCSATCGGGIQTRTKKILVQAAHGGFGCPPSVVLKEDRLCNTQRCPYDCRQTKWSPWTECDKKCDGGQQTRFRHTMIQPSGGGRPCGPSAEHQNCNSHSCPVDCLLSEWYNWGACSVSCGMGVEKRIREITIPQMHGGTPCGKLVEERTCEPRTHLDQPIMCPEHCEVSEWSEWSECSVSCGKFGGEKYRKRLVLKSHKHNGKKCPHLTQGTFCNRFECPVDCELFDWREWSDCDQSCDSGNQYRVRQIRRNSFYGGKECDANQREDRACNTKACRVDCVLSGWDKFSKCDCKGTDFGIKTHERYVITKNSVTGLKCPSIYHIHPHALPGSTIYRESLKCTARDCLPPPTPYPTKYPTKSPTTAYPTPHPTKFPTHSPTQAPTKTPGYCKYGDEKTFRVVDGQGGFVPANSGVTQVHGGGSQPWGFTGKDGAQIIGAVYMGGKGPWKVELKAFLNAAVKDDVQSVDFFVGDKKMATLWANTAKKDAAGLMLISEHVNVWTPETTPLDFVMHYKFVFNGGDILVQDPQATCVDETTDCKMSEWTDYTPCSKSCEGGERMRTRTVLQHPSEYGKKCSPVLKETSPCNIHRCPWEKTIQAEDGELNNCIVGGSLSGFTGTGFVRSMGRGNPCEITWSIDAPIAGRYEILYRYETKNGGEHDIVLEAIDHAYTVTVDFPRSENAWTTAKAYVDLFKGVNDITLKSKHRSLNIDSITLVHMNMMQRCTPGETIKLDWLKGASHHDGVEMSSNRVPGLVPDSAADGHAKGRFDFGSRGPWEVRFDVMEPKFGGSKSTLHMSLNDFNHTLKSTHLNDDKYHSYTMIVQGPSLQFNFKFEDSTADERDHLQVRGGFAVCQGCKHVSCAIETGPKTWEWQINPGESKHARTSAPTYKDKFASGWYKIATGNKNHATNAGQITTVPCRPHTAGCHYQHVRTHLWDTKRVVVRHHNKEFGKYDENGHRWANKVGSSTVNHQCAFNKDYNKCECTCASKEEIAYSAMT